MKVVYAHNEYSKKGKKCVMERYNERVISKTYFKYVKRVDYKNGTPTEYLYQYHKLKIFRSGFDNAKSAAIALDKELIKHNKQPLILKKL